MSFLVYLGKVAKLNKSLSGLLSSNQNSIYKEWRNQIESRKNPLDLELPWITILAKNYIEEYLSKRSMIDTRVFEYGSGGSSVFFLKYASKVVSVEHDKKWFDLVRKRVNEKNIQGWDGYLIEPELIDNTQNNLDISNPHHYYSDDVRPFGYTFKNYASYISNFPDQYFDIVLIDGRSRPSCLFHSVNKIKKGGLLILDNAEREHYLSQKVVSQEDFKLVISSWGALISYNQLTKTHVYIRK